MRVQEVLLECNRKRYMLLDYNGKPIIPVMKYLKYLDSRGKKANTQKTYCYGLKHYFQYLDEINYDYKEINLDKLVDYVSWLSSPFQSNKVTPIKAINGVRTEKTINLIISIVTNFYDYLYRNEEITFDLMEKLIKKGFTGVSSKYKDFLYHVNKGRPIGRNILKLKEPRRKTKILSKEQVQQLLFATTNIRDKLLLQILFETGLRIGEALSLYIEDFKLSHKEGHRIKLVDRGELVNGASLKTGEREIYISQTLMDLYDDYLYEILDDLNLTSDFLFVKIRGGNIGDPMNYKDVSSLFKRLRIKTNINVTPHLFRHYVELGVMGSLTKFTRFYEYPLRKHSP